MAISLSDRVIHFLNGAEVGRIRFTFPEAAATITINRAMYGRVAKAIKDHRIGIFPATDPGLIRRAPAPHMRARLKKAARSS
jgi:hypothetical protein